MSAPLTALTGTTAAPHSPRPPAGRGLPARCAAAARMGERSVSSGSDVTPDRDLFRIGTLFTARSRRAPFDVHAKE